MVTYKQASATRWWGEDAEFRVLHTGRSVVPLLVVGHSVEGGGTHIRLSLWSSHPSSTLRLTARITMKISSENTRFVDAKDFTANFYVEKKDGREFNALLVNCLKRHYKTKLTGATRAYIVLEGSGWFTINDRKEEAHQHDLFIVSGGDVYEYEGSMKLFEFNVPATDTTNEERLD